MKKLFIILSAVMISATLWAQSPDKMSYQAVIRNNSNQLLTNTQIGMKISIMKGVPPYYTAVYWEIQTPTTNANGLVSLEIGGTYTGFDTIHWDNGTYFIKTETDPMGGVNYTITGESQLLSVPFALHSKTAESLTGGIIETDPVFGISPAAGITGANITNWNSNMLPSGTMEQTLYYNGTSWTPANNLRNDGVIVSINDLQTNVLDVQMAMNLNAMPGTSPMYVISDYKVNNLNADLLDGKHAADFLTSFTETDPVYGASPAAGITGSDITYWNTMLPAGSSGQTLYHNGTSWLPASNITNNGFDIWINSLTTHFPIEADQGMISSGPIYINHSPGMPPMYVTSSIKVDNLNVDYLDGKHAADFLTSFTETDPVFGASPAAGVTSTNIFNWNNNMLPAGASGQTLRHDGSFWAAASNLYNDGTRIGIGMVPNYDVLLDIHAGSSQPFAMTHYTSSITGSFTTDGFMVGLSGNDGLAYVWNHEAQPIIFGTSSTDRMIIDASGNLGIGTSLPLAQLHTTGSVKFEGAGVPGAGKVLTSDATGNATWQSSSAIPSGTNGQTLRYSGSSWVANSTLFNDGTNVGIGTSTPSQMLDVSGGSIKTSGQLISTQTAGTAPLSVISNTLVTNLNADMLDGVHAGNASGNIPVSNGTVNVSLNADMVDGTHQAVNSEWLSFNSGLTANLHTFVNCILETVGVSGLIRIRCTSSDNVKWVAYVNGVRSVGVLTNGTFQDFNILGGNDDLKIIITSGLNNLHQGIVEIHQVNSGYMSGIVWDTFSAY